MESDEKNNDNNLIQNKIFVFIHYSFIIFL